MQKLVMLTPFQLAPLATCNSPFSARHRHGMVKDQKLWREIQLQYAKLREDEVGADLLPPDAGGEGSAGDRCNLERN